MRKLERSSPPASPDGEGGAVAALSDSHGVEEAEERLRGALLGSPAVVFGQDRNLVYTWVANPAGRWAPEDVVGKTDADLLGREDAKRMIAFKRSVLSSGASARQTLPLTIDGEQRWFDLRAAPVVDRSGRTVGITGAGWDVTALARARDEAGHLAVLEERNRLSREIHDSLAQGIVGVVLQLEAAEADLAGAPSSTRAAVLKARDALRQVLDECRRSVLALRPQLLEDGDLGRAIDHLAVELGAHTQAAVRASVHGTPRRLAPELEQNLVRVAQEALRNAVRHAGATRIQVELAYDDDGTRLAISDDGRGFDVSAARSKGFGLRSLSERCEQMGAALVVESGPGRGARVEVRLPGGSRSRPT